jgi:hypothetical protein
MPLTTVAKPVLTTESHFRFAPQNRPLNQRWISSVWAVTRSLVGAAEHMRPAQR